MQFKSISSSIGLLILRIGFGVYLFTHGWPKFQMVLVGNFQFRDYIGWGSTTSLLLIVLAEVLCSVLVVVGLLTRFAAIPPVIAMTVAAFIVHGSDPWTMGEGVRLYRENLAPSWASKEPALLFAIAFLTLVFTGPGRFSLDALIWRKKAS